MSDFNKVGHYVQAKGLVNAKELNGKIGRITKKKNKLGRLAVQFMESDDDDDDDDNKPKLIKEINLQEVPPFPLDKDEPWGTYRNPDGSEARIRIENGKGKSCVECNCDLDGKYYLHEFGEYRCEEHYVTKFAPGQEIICAQCHTFVESRLMMIQPEGLPFSEMYRKDGVFYTHKKCGSCTLCGSTIDQARHGFEYQKTNESEDSLEFEITCKGPPGSTGWCSNEIGAYKKASKRLEELNKMNLENIQKILKERQVSWRSDEIKDSLVCKVIVTDKKKGDKKRNIVTRTDASGNETHVKVKSREAPGAILRDRRCNHGSQRADNSAQKRKRSAFAPIIMTMMQTAHNYNMLHNAIADFLVDRQDELKDDIQERFIPGFLWGGAVESTITEEGGFQYAAMHIFAYLIIDSVIDRIASMSPTEKLAKRDVLDAFNRPDIRETLWKIMSSEDALYLFMHQFGKRYCDCMKFVVAAAEVGSLRLGQKMKVVVDVEHCALCNAALAQPLVCSGCKEVAYCDALHQREHWKVHKTECKGRKNKIQR